MIADQLQRVDQSERVRVDIQFRQVKFDLKNRHRKTYALASLVPSSDRYSVETEIEIPVSFAIGIANIILYLKYLLFSIYHAILALNFVLIFLRNNRIILILLIYLLRFKKKKNENYTFLDNTTCPVARFFVNKLRHRLKFHFVVGAVYHHTNAIRV